jgi:5-formyltetrahydrofolate cyclo-ligase
MDKQTLRSIFLEKRKMLSSEEYTLRNQLLAKRFFQQVNLEGVEYIHVFMPIRKNKEPDTWPIIEELWEKHPEIKVITSVSDLKTNHMKHFHITPETTFEENKWGIPEPSDAKQVDLSKLQLILVPMIIGTKSGHRIGYGKGYYDRFLSECEGVCSFKTIGLTLLPPLEGKLYFEAFDKPLHHLLTPFEFLSF